jgi:nicotinamidase-related amidase
MLANITRVASAFRAAGLPVVHAHVAHRPDFGGVLANSAITARARKAGSMRSGTPDVEAMAGLESRVVVGKPFNETPIFAPR